LVSLSIDGKVKGVTLKALVPETIRHVLNGLGVKKTNTIGRQDLNPASLLLKTRRLARQQDTFDGFPPTLS
jgi:hypothetical protein